jgi:hypothetical protein
MGVDWEAGISKSSTTTYASSTPFALDEKHKKGTRKTSVPAKLAVRPKEHAAIHACLIRPVAPKVVVCMALQPECKRAGHHPGCKGQRGGAGSEQVAPGRARRQAEGAKERR